MAVRRGVIEIVLFPGLCRSLEESKPCSSYVFLGIDGNAGIGIDCAAASGIELCSSADYLLDGRTNERTNRQTTRRTFSGENGIRATGVIWVSDAFT